MPDEDPKDARDPNDPVGEFSDFARDPACAPWEALIASSVDGTLSAKQEESLARHISACSRCAATLEASREGAGWMALLDRQPPAPDRLLERILTQTGPAAAESKPPASFPLAEIPGIPRLGTENQSAVTYAQSGAHQSHWLLTAAMAIFSIALTLNLAGNRLPRAGSSGAFGVATQFHSASGLAASYYESFSQTQAGIVDQIKTVLKDLKYSAVKQIGTASIESQRKSS